MKSKEDVYQLIRIYIKVVDSNLKKENILVQNAYGLVTKCLEHSISTTYLLLGINIPEIPISYKDLSTPNVTARAALESLLTFSYIFYLPTNSDQKELRYLSWHMSGLVDRQKYKAKTEEQKAKKIFENSEIELLKIKIQKNESFDQLTAKEKKRVLGGEWRLESWTSIGTQIGFNKHKIEQLYNYLCSYAHSGGLSNIQIQHSLLGGKNEMPGSMSEVALPMIMANMINLFCSVSPHSKEELEKDKSAKETVGFWVEFSKRES